MKKIIALTLVAALLAVCCSGCKKKDNSTAETETQETGGLTHALEEEGNADGPGYTITDVPIDDSDTDGADNTGTTTDTENAVTESTYTSGDVMPFATEAPQPNASIASFTEVSGTGLGFKFNYPTGWTNLPGRSTVCYIQPLTNGTVYPARVAVTMKRLYHPCDAEEVQLQLSSFLSALQLEFNNGVTDKTKKFKVAASTIDELDTSVKFMGKPAYATTYVAYDGSQEIKGYVIITHFERYIFVFHFMCAYADYDSFYPSMCRMRDSVQVEATD